MHMAITRCQTALLVSSPTDAETRFHTSSTICDLTDGRLGGTISDLTDGRRHKKWSSHTQRGMLDSSLALSAAEQLTCIVVDVVEVTGKHRKRLIAN